jgi:hypothetical protein
MDHKQFQTDQQFSAKSTSLLIFLMFSAAKLLDIISLSCESPAFSIAPFTVIKNRLAHAHLQQREATIAKQTASCWVLLLSLSNE